MVPPKMKARLHWLRFWKASRSPPRDMCLSKRPSFLTSTEEVAGTQSSLLTCINLAETRFPCFSLPRSSSKWNSMVSSQCQFTWPTFCSICLWLSFPFLPLCHSSTWARGKHSLLAKLFWYSALSQSRFSHSLIKEWQFSFSWSFSVAISSWLKARSFSSTHRKHVLMSLTVLQVKIFTSPWLFQWLSATW